MNIRYHADTLIIETFLANETLVKNADGVLSDLPAKIEEYVRSKMKPGHEIESVLSMLVPGALFLFLKSSNPILAFLLSAAAGTFQTEIEGIIETIFNAVKPDIVQGKKVDPAKIDRAVATATAEQAAPTPAPTPTSTPAKEDDDGLNIESSFKSQLKFARKLKLALIAYNNDNSAFQFSKYAIPAGVTSAGTKTFLGRIIGWLFKTILLSAGFLLIGDLINDKVLDRPNSLNGGLQKGVRQESGPASTKPAAIVSTQTKFKPNPALHDETHADTWGVSVQATPAAIEEMLINFAKEVYLGLNGLENIIRSSPAFQIVKNRIVNNNKSNEGYNVTAIPGYLASKKQIVDTFIDDVAKMSP